MPTLRKIPPEVARNWSPPQQNGVSHLPNHYAWLWRPAILFITPRPLPLSETPKIGAVLRLCAPEDAPPTATTGVALDVRVDIDGHWNEVYLAFARETRWVAATAIADNLGRIKGVSRIDQPNKYIHGRVHGGMHGWFVRVYRGKTPYLTASFSDDTAGDRRAALKAALAFHSANVDLDASQGIPFD